jgi:hypothetical protein
VLTVVDRSIGFLNCACIPEFDKECLLGSYSYLQVYFILLYFCMIVDSLDIQTEYVYDIYLQVHFVLSY